MVAQQILRDLARGGVAAALLAALASPARADDAKAKPPADEAVVIVDLRSGDPAKQAESRAELAKKLRGVSGIALRTSASLDRALAGQAHDPLGGKAKASLDAAASAYGKLDCKAAAAHASAAALAYAGLQARGDGVTGQLERAYVYALLCADSAGKTDAALAAAGLLRRVRESNADDKPPARVSEAVWKRYPAIDAATNVLMSTVAVSSEPTGAVVYLDHRKAGVTPAKLVVPQGNHIIALSAEGHQPYSKRHQISADTQVSVALSKNPQADHDKVRRRVAAWKKGTASAQGLAQLMRDVGVRFAFVVSGRTVQVWGVQKYAKKARLLGRKLTSQPVELGALVVDHAKAWDGRAPDPSLPLLRETRTTTVAKKKPQKWWVYGIVLGAVAVGAAIIAVQDLADDRQRFELTFP